MSDETIAVTPMPDAATIESKVRAIISQQNAIDLAEIHGDSHLYNDLNFDSLATVEMVIELEDVFDLTVPDDVNERVKTVGDVIAEVESLLAAKEAT